MDTKTILNDASGRMQKAIDHLEEELLNVRAGKASPNALNGVMVDYFGSQVPISGAASVTVPDAKTILIQPWDKNMLRAIEKAIIDSNIGLALRTQCVISSWNPYNIDRYRFAERNFLGFAIGVGIPLFYVSQKEKV